MALYFLFMDWTNENVSESNRCVSFIESNFEKRYYILKKIDRWFSCACIIVRVMVYVASIRLVNQYLTSWVLKLFKSYRTWQSAGKIFRCLFKWGRQFIFSSIESRHLLQYLWSSSNGFSMLSSEVFLSLALARIRSIRLVDSPIIIDSGEQINFINNSGNTRSNKI